MHRSFLRGFLLVGLLVPVFTACSYDPAKQAFLQECKEVVRKDLIRPESGVFVEDDDLLLKRIQTSPKYYEVGISVSAANLWATETSTHMTICKKNRQTGEIRQSIRGVEDF